HDVRAGRDHLKQAMEAALRVLLHPELGQDRVVARLVRDHDRWRTAGQDSVSLGDGWLGQVGSVGSRFQRHLRSPFRQAYSSPKSRIPRKTPIRTIPCTAMARTTTAHR